MSGRPEGFISLFIEEEKSRKKSNRRQNWRRAA
jgi:hypothetical protein